MLIADSDGCLGQDGLSAAVLSGVTIFSRDARALPFGYQTMEIMDHKKLNFPPRSSCWEMEKAAASVPAREGTCFLKTNFTYFYQLVRTSLAAETEAQTMVMGGTMP